MESRKAVVSGDGRSLTVIYAGHEITLALPFSVWDWAAIQRIEDEKAAQSREAAIDVPARA